MKLITFLNEIRQWRELYFVRRPLILTLGLVIIGILLIPPLRSTSPDKKGDPSLYSGQPVAVTGIIIGPPDPRPKGTVYIIEVETLKSLRKPYSLYSTPGKLLAHVSGSIKTLALPGERVRISGTLQKPNRSKIPGTFDYKKYLATKKIFSVIYTSSRSLENLGVSYRYRWLQFGSRVRNHIQSTFENNLSSENAAVLGGLVIGVRPRFHPEIRDIFIRSGTMHILVASGSNMAFVIGFWFWMIRLLFRLKPRWALFSSLPIAWLYVYIVGADPPILRAGVMATIGILGYVLMREDRPIHSLCVAALCLLLPNPLMLFDAGFLMSFISVFGMIYYLPRVDIYFQNRPFLMRWICRLFAATLTAQLWLFPITTTFFKQFFPVGLLSNIFVLPLSGVGLWGGFSLVLFEQVPFLSDALAFCLNFYLTGFVGFIRFFAFLSGQGLWLSPPSRSWIIGFYLVLLLIVFVRRSYLARLGTIIGVTLIFTATLWSWIESRPSKKFTLTWIDQGRSNATLIEIPTGEKILINPGPTKTTNVAERTLLPFLKEKKFSELDAILITKSNPDRTDSVRTLYGPMNKPPVYVFHQTQPEKWEPWVYEFVPPGKRLAWGELSVESLNGSRAFDTDSPLLLRYKNKTIVLAHVLSLRSQRELLARGIGPVHILQARFSPSIRWDGDFLNVFSPNLLIETGPNTTYRPSQPPWGKTKLVIPQKLGYFKYQL